MSGGKFHVHGPHDHAVEHASHEGADKGPAQYVAIFTAVLATIGAIVSYQGGHSQNEALYYKNDAVLEKANASNQWALFQSKGTKQNLAELAEGLAVDPTVKARYAEEVKRYKAEKEVIKLKAEALEAKSQVADERSKSALNPHDKLAQAMTFIQIAISLAAIFLLTGRRWMFGLAGGAATIGLGYWIAAFFAH